MTPSPQYVEPPYTSIDKSEWPPGPWHDEADLAKFMAHGLACTVMRHDRYGHLCGYVHCVHNVPEDFMTEDVSGGSRDVYGFDCHHIDQYGPGDHNPSCGPDDYCTMDEVIERTKELAKALRRGSVWWRRALRRIETWWDGE